MPEGLHLAFWNVENLFDEEDASRRVGLGGWKNVDVSRFSDHLPVGVRLVGNVRTIKLVFEGRDPLLPLNSPIMKQPKIITWKFIDNSLDRKSVV